MNIGRTIRVFRAEPLESPVPAPAVTAKRSTEIADAPPVEVDAGQLAPPARLGG